MFCSVTDHRKSDFFFIRTGPRFLNKIQPLSVNKSLGREQTGDAWTFLTGMLSLGGEENTKRVLGEKYNSRGAEN